MKNGCFQRLLFFFLLFVGAGLILGAHDLHAQTPTVTYTYDDLGRLKRVIDQNGEIRTYTYDAVGNILSIEAGPGACPAGPPTIFSVEFVGPCQVGAPCRIVIVGSNLQDAGITSPDINAAVTDCITDCSLISCQVTVTPSATPVPFAIVVTTPFGTDQATLSVPPPPNLTTTGQANLWHFAANRGEHVIIAMDRIVNKPDGSSTLDPFLELKDSREFLLINDDDSGGSVPPGPGKNALINGFTLPATDTYMVVARGARGSIGPYTLTIDPPTIALLPGPPTEPLTPKFTFSGAIATAGERDTLTFAADKGTLVNIEVNRVANNPDGSGTLDPAMDLQDSRGFLLRSDNDGGTNQPPGPGRNASIPNFTLPATDTYRIVVSGSSRTKGPYAVKVFFLE